MTVKFLTVALLKWLHNGCFTSENAMQRLLHDYTNETTTRIQMPLKNAYRPLKNTTVDVDRAAIQSRRRRRAWL
jgi:hypothetical protein